jgi:hypothetical protein
MEGRRSLSDARTIEYSILISRGVRFDIPQGTNGVVEVLIAS